MTTRALLRIGVQNFNVGAGALFLHPGLRFFRKLTVEQQTIGALFLRRIGFINLARIQQLNQMPAERGVHRLAGFAFAQAQQRIAEGGIVNFWRVPAQIAALVGGTRIVGELFRCCGEAGFAAFDVIGNLLQLLARLRVGMSVIPEIKVK